MIYIKLKNQVILRVDSLRKNYEIRLKKNIFTNPIFIVTI